MKTTLIFVFIFIRFTLFSQHYFQQKPENPNTINDVKKEIFEGYYSNYFSFHGEDSLGKVYFAIDNNRQKTKKNYKGNNFLYFNANDEWKELKGHEKFTSTENNVEKVPSTEHFKFNYNGEDLSSIESPNNGFRVECNLPLVKVGDYGGDGMFFNILTTKATLYYKGRTVKGNLISEQLVDSVGLKTIKNMMKVLVSGFKFDGYYLNVKNFGDLYIHLVESKAAVGIFKSNIYNLHTSLKTLDLELKKENYTVIKWKRFGLKRLAQEIEINLPNAKLTLHTTHFKKYRNLLFFAFGMGTVEGELIYQGNTYPVYGLSELFKF